MLQVAAEDYDKPVVLASVPLLLKFVQYEQRYPDFPTNLTEVIQMALAPNHPVRGQEYKAGFIVMTVMASMTVLARLWTRKYYHKAGLWWDDYLAVVAMLFAWVWTVIAVLSFTIGGVGMHVWSASYHTLCNGLKFEVFDQIAYNFAAIFTKLSILFFILRITPPTSALMYRTVIVTMVLFTSNFIVQDVMILTACTPARASWELGLRFEKFECLDWWHLVIGQSVAWSVTDLWSLLLPIPLVWDLRAPLKQKIGMVILFSFGGGAVIASIVKIAYLKGVYNSWDPTWNAIPVLFWFHAEICIGLIAGSLPGLSVFLLRLIPVVTRTSRMQYTTNMTDKTYKSRGDRGEEMPVITKTAVVVNDRELSLSEEGAFEHPNLGRDRDNNILPLIPLASSARITTAIATLNPEPEPDGELFLHYPANSAASQGPVPALRPTHVPGFGMTSRNAMNSLTKSPKSVGSSSFDDYDDDFRSLPSLRHVDDGPEQSQWTAGAVDGNGSQQRSQHYLPSFRTLSERRSRWTRGSDMSSEQGFPSRKVPRRTSEAPSEHEVMPDIDSASVSATEYDADEKDIDDIEKHRNKHDREEDDDDDHSVDLIIQRPSTSQAR